MENALRPWSPQLLSVLRIVSGLLILQSGMSKWLNFPVGQFNNASIQTMSGVAGIFELVGGALLIIGLFTRPVAFILSGLYAVAYFYAHSPRGFYPLLNAGGYAVLLSFVFLYIAAAGGGPWSVDRMWRGTKD